MGGIGALDISCAKIDFSLSLHASRENAFEKNGFSIKSAGIFNHTTRNFSATSLYNCKCDMCGGARNFRVKGGIGARRFNHLLMCVGTGKAGSGEGIKMIVWQNCLIASKLCTWLSGWLSSDGEEMPDYTCWCWPTAHRRACACVAMHGNCPFYFVLSSRWWEFFVRVTTASDAAAATRRINWQLLGRQQPHCVGQAAAFRHTHLKIHAISTRSRARKIKMHALDARGAARLFHLPRTCRRRLLQQKCVQSHADI